MDKLEERSEVRIAPGLRTWRTAVTAAENPSQLSICVEQLSASIAWDKSIMKVYCQVSLPLIVCFSVYVYCFQSLSSEQGLHYGLSHI